MSKFEMMEKAFLGFSDAGDHYMYALDLYEERGEHDPYLAVYLEDAGKSYREAHEAFKKAHKSGTAEIRQELADLGVRL